MQLLGIYKHRTNVPITSVFSEGTVKNKVLVTLVNRSKDEVQIPFEALVVPKIPGLFPDEFIRQTNLSLNELADPHYHIPNPVDLLLGAGVWASIITPQVEQLPTVPQLVVQSTLLGKVIFGKSENPGKGLKSFHMTSPPVDDDMKLDQLLLRYWNADEIPTPRKWTADEEAVEANFVSTHRRNDDGRYIVSIPRRTVCPPLGNSYRLAKACFFSVERKMERNPDLKRRYKEIFDDYRASGHMIEAPPRGTRNTYTICPTTQLITTLKRQRGSSAVYSTHRLNLQMVRHLTTSSCLALSCSLTLLRFSFDFGCGNTV